MKTLLPQASFKRLGARRYMKYLMAASLAVAMAILLPIWLANMTVNASSQFAPGDLDTTFNGTGLVTTSIGEGNDTAYRVLVQPDGKILVAGAGYETTTTDYVVLRYNSDGTLDPSFGDNGIAQFDISTRNSRAVTITPLADGAFLIGGIYGWSASTNVLGIIKVNADGTRDMSFGTSGLATVFRINDLAGLYVLPDGKIIAGGSGPDGTLHSRMTVYRLNADGSTDNTWGFAGEVQIFFPSQTEDFGRAMALQTDG